MILMVTGILTVATPASSNAASIGYNMLLRVPVYCKLTHSAINFGIPVGADGISLGQLNEYCNSPGGYNLTINYTPGTLRGARITAGDEEIVLNGSGRDLLSKSTGPRIQERSISAIPGVDGFNTSRIELQIDVN
jgi:hypothetical protein